jgi:hypothetical protein
MKMEGHRMNRGVNCQHGLGGCSKHPKIRISAAILKQQLESWRRTSFDNEIISFVNV